VGVPERAAFASSGLFVNWIEDTEAVAIQQLKREKTKPQELQCNMAFRTLRESGVCVGKALVRRVTRYERTS
jgi:hypothetical protein